MFPRFAKASLTFTPTRKPIMAQIKTFAFVDLETTGLPSMENNKTKVTEITIVAVQSEHLRSGVIPRVHNKLSICVNPCRLVSIDSENITGLSNLILEHQAPFTKTTVQMINNFLEHSLKPICLVAHNGNFFDYPILRTEIEKTGHSLLENVLCIDSLQAFRETDAQVSFSETISQEVRAETKSHDTQDSIPMEFQDGFNEMLCQAMDEFETYGDSTEKRLKRALKVQKINETTPKKSTKTLDVDAVDFALDEKIDNVVGLKKMVVDHSGEGSSNGKKFKAVNSRKMLNFSKSYKLGDVYQRLTNKKVVDAHQAENDVLMLVMCAATLGEKFVDWANENAQNFADIPKMMPGKKIGT